MGFNLLLFPPPPLSPPPSSLPSYLRLTAPSWCRTPPGCLQDGLQQGELPLLSHEAVTHGSRLEADVSQHKTLNSPFFFVCFCFKHSDAQNYVNVLSYKRNGLNVQSAHMYFFVNTVLRQRKTYLF